MCLEETKRKSVLSRYNYLNINHMTLMMRKMSNGSDDDDDDN